MPLIPQPSKLIQCTDLSSCFQAIYNFFFALLVALAFLYFLYGAFQYLLSGAKIFQKEEGKKKMQNSVIALIIALTIPIILNMINPGVFRPIELLVPKVEVRLPVLIISAPETNAAEDILKQGEKIYDAPPNQTILNELKNKNIKYISRLEVSCESQTMRIYGIDNKNQEILITSVIIKTGKPVNGKKCNAENIPNSNTTPKGTFTITDKKYNPNGIFSKESGASLGTRILVYYSPRGLYVHGSGTQKKDEKFPITAGCIRMKNADLAAIYEWVSPNVTQLVIHD